METIEYQGKRLRLETPAQLDEYCGGVAFFAFADDADGRRYTIRWDYIEPEWCESLTPEEKNSVTDLSDFADWENPAEVKED